MIFVQPLSPGVVRRKFEGWQTKIIVMDKPSPKVTVEQILAYGIQRSRPLLLDRNVIAAFGVFFRMGLKPTTVKPAPSK